LTELQADVTPVDPAEVDEYERRPVPERALLGFKSFVGQYAGEHTAGEWHGLMEGALRSGLRAAADLWS